MTSTSLYQQHNSLHEEEQPPPGGGAAALHERLVAYVHALTGPHEQRTGVWVEHSYARARGAAGPPAAHVRVLLAPAADEGPVPATVDVCAASPPRPSPPPDDCDSDGGDNLSDDDEIDEDEVRARLKTHAPSAEHAHLAGSALDTLRRLRLARLASGRRARPEATLAAARRLRLALAAVSERSAAPWLHSALLANLPRSTRTLYEKVLAALRRSAPRLAERLMGVHVRAAAHSWETHASGEAPCLVWVCGVSPGLEARWARRLGAVLHVVRAQVLSPAAAAPESWCAALFSGARVALADALTEAGERAVVVGGAGPCAVLSAALCAAGARVAGLLLLAPPLLTAEGARDAADDPLAEVRVPTLVVAGTGAAASWRGAAREACRARGAATRRLLEVRGADDALRVPRVVRERLQLPQRALDAAIAEECARWAAETTESAAGDTPPRDRDRERERHRERPRRRGGASPAPRAGTADPPHGDYAHLPPARAASPDTTGSERPLEPAAAGVLGEGAGGSRRVVSRGAGGTPMALLPPRRTAPAPPLRAADIMQLPIVFADDEPAPAPPAAVTVTSGARGGGYTRVIVAKRGAGRPVLLRRGVRFTARGAGTDTAD